MDFNLTKVKREAITKSVISQLETIYNDPVKELDVIKPFDQEEIRSIANKFSFDQVHDVEEVMNHVILGIKNYSVHVTHPSYLGLFNPRPNFPSVMADVINSYLNPQLAAWSHSPYAGEIERLVIREFCAKFGYPDANRDGTFCTGGAESNLTAVLCALHNSFPSFEENGLMDLEKTPLIYCSTESHHSVEKAARIVGLGKNSIKKIPVLKDLSIDTIALRQHVKKDRDNGLYPMMVIGTAGTTGAGAIDDLSEIADICSDEDLWFHVDAAYGGGLILSSYKKELQGIELSDSITLDLHKWFSVPMATSLFLTRDTSILQKTFGVKTSYMPEDGDPNKVIDSYVHSMQWSRRFIGLKIYLPLAVFGWEGYGKVITDQIKMGHTFRQMLTEKGWIINNKSNFPIICFSHPRLKSDQDVLEIIEEIIASGETWISSYPINGELNLRAQIVNYSTQLADLEKFVSLAEQAIVKYTKA